jgi:4-amino-4-deoxychorismate lyase
MEKAIDPARAQVVKVIVTRGPGARGYAPPPSPSPTRIVICAPVPEQPAEYSQAGVTVRLCSTRIAFQPRLAGVKHLNRLENVLARAEWTDPGIAEGLVMDGDGHLVGGTMTNLFLAEAGELVTPDLARGGVAGVTRERVIDGAARHGVRCRVEPVTWQRLERAGEVLLVNSVIGAWGVKACGELRWTTGRSTQRVREWLDEDGI